MQNVSFLFKCKNLESSLLPLWEEGCKQEWHKTFLEKSFVYHLLVINEVQYKIGDKMDETQNVQGGIWSWQKCQHIAVSYSILLTFTGSELDSLLASDEFGKRSKKFCTMDAFGCQQSILGVRTTWNMKNEPTGQGPRICLACPLHISFPRCWWGMLAILKLFLMRILGDSTWLQPRGGSSVLLTLVNNCCYLYCNLLSRKRSCTYCTYSVLVSQHLALTFWTFNYNS